MTGNKLTIPATCLFSGGDMAHLRQHILRDPSRITKERQHSCAVSVLQRCQLRDFTVA